MNDEAILIALVLTIIIAAITSAGFWQGIGIFIMMYIVAAAFVSKTYDDK
jgi:energy-coupling factor transporter transmembrane protein EcfT